jgi:predicted  nucleic acid-binding Zn-ribbon protein
MTTERWTDESLDRFASIITTAIAASNERLTRIEQLQGSNAEAIAANNEAIAASNERLTRTEQIVESNARAIQSLGDDIAELRLSMQEGFERSEQNWARASQAIEGVANLMASLDSDRPTILRKLNVIEGKVDRLLEQQ